MATTLRLPAELTDRLHRQAAHEHVSAHALIQRAVESYLDSHDDEVRRIADRIARRDAGLLARLAE